MSNIVKYETDNGTVELTPETIKRYLVSGDPSKVTDQEIMMFLNLCRYQKLNPFLREAYLIKFGNEPATIVTGKDTFTKRAAKSPLCNGYEAGVIVQKKDGEIEYRKGTLVAPNETLIGGWAKVYRKDWSVPLETSVSLQEYQRYNKEGKLFSNWAKMPATMIRKVALVQALREALPEEFQGLYSPEEMPVDSTILEEKPIEVQPAQETDTITPAQRKRLFAIAKNTDIVKAAIHEFGYEHTNDIKKKDYDAICSLIEEMSKEATQENENPTNSEQEEET